MRVVLELGDWVLAEDDAGEVRLWSNGVTGESRSYQDVPPEVEAALASDDGPPISQPQAQPAPALPPKEDPPAPAAVPFRRACGTAAEPQAGAVPFKRSCGTSVESKPAAAPAFVASAAAAGAAAAADAARNPAMDAAPASRSPFPLCPEGYLGDSAAPTAPEDPSYADESEGLHDRTAMLSSASHPIAAETPAEAEPDPEVTRPDDLPQWPAKEAIAAMLVKSSSIRQDKKETQDSFLLKLTHAHLGGKSLTSMGQSFQLCPRLKVLNLDGNHLQDLRGLRPGTEILKLKGNDVWELCSWTRNLPSLTTLDLAENRLAVFAGFSSSRQLQELSLRSQVSNVPLQLHLPTLKIFFRSLRVLDISRNRMTDIDPVSSLMMLQRLDASCNMLGDMPAVGNVLQRLSQLSWLCLEENPVCWMRKYRDLVIIAAQASLEHLDGKDIQANERPFLVQLHSRRQRRNSSEPPGKARSGASSPSPTGSPTSAPSSQARSASLGRAGPPPLPPDLAPPAGPVGAAPCAAQPMRRGPRSRSSSIDPAARHYRKRMGGPATKLPPLPPRT